MRFIKEDTLDYTHYVHFARYDRATNPYLSYGMVLAFSTISLPVEGEGPRSGGKSSPTLKFEPYRKVCYNFFYGERLLLLQEAFIHHFFN